jgi:hypothetical protein
MTENAAAINSALSSVHVIGKGCLKPLIAELRQQSRTDVSAKFQWSCMFDKQVSNKGMDVHL